jgi:uncharacterized membrane protein YsdA (DUF1294 family)
VTYECATDDKGRAQAKGVAFVGERAVAPAAPGRSALPPLFAAGFLVLLGVLAWQFYGRLPLAVLGLYVVASVVAFLAYGHDKSAAVRKAWRVQESTLHLFSLLGGWPGALAAQRLFRHKSSKASFQTTYWITVVLNCAALGWLLSPYGAQTLQAVLAPGLAMSARSARITHCRACRATGSPGRLAALAGPLRPNRANRKLEGTELPIGDHQPDLFDARAAQGWCVGHCTTAPARLKNIERQPQRGPLPGGWRERGLVIDAIEAAVGAQVELVAVAVAAHEEFDRIDVRGHRR